MSENPNPETPNTETPATKPKDPDGYAVAFRTMQADMSRLALALALGVAVDLGAELGQLLPLLGELAVAGLHLALEVVSKIRDALPHASDLELRGEAEGMLEEWKQYQQLLRDLALGRKVKPFPEDKLPKEVRRRRACGAEADAPAQAKGRVRG